MSNHLISTVYKRDLGTGTRKSIMAYLADKASDDGRGIYTEAADQARLAAGAIKQLVQWETSNLVSRLDTNEA